VRLLKNASVCARLQEARSALSATCLQLAVIDRDQRLLAIQDRWDRVRTAVVARSTGDYAGMMRTGIVCRRLRWLGGKDGKVVEEYEIDTAAIEALNSIEKRAAIETGQEQENIQVTGRMTPKAVALTKIMTLPELEELERKMLKAMEEEKSGKVVEAPK